jgi:hypothetical protein
MARMAKDESLPAALRARMFAELANYAAPRRKAVELSGSVAQPVELEVDLSEFSNDELETLTQLLRKAGVKR